MKHHLSIDIETRSSVDIGKAGAYKYAQSPDFEILLFAYQMDEEEVQLIDLAQGETFPETLRLALQDEQIIKHAYNAAFEWYCLNQAGYRTPLEQWRCTMVHGLYCGYTAGLAATGRAIGLPQDKQKLRNMTYTDVKIKDLELKGWTFDDKDLKDFIVIYVMNEKGETCYYQYEVSEETLQLFNGYTIDDASYDQLHATRAQGFVTAGIGTGAAIIMGIVLVLKLRKMK